MSHRVCGYCGNPVTMGHRCKEMEAAVAREAGMITCENCGHKFDLAAAPGAAGISADGQFTGICPMCTHGHMTEQEGPEVEHSEQDIANIVLALELGGDNLCQRVVDLLWERMHLPSAMRGL